MKTLTVIAPAYNEAQGIVRFYEVLRSQLDALTGYEAEILIVVDGGTDETFELLEPLVLRDPLLRVIKLSTNFGQQMALLAGIDNTTSDAIIMMDADLQHPPATIPELIAAFEKGNDVVYTVREINRHVSVLRRLAGHLFYWFINTISDVPINENASDFRLISRRVAVVLQEKIRERNLFLRGIISWMGFAQACVRFTAEERIAGKSKYSLAKLISFAIFGIISFSKKPLRAASVMGLLAAVGGVIFALITIAQYFLGQISQPGFATIVVLITIFGGLQLFFLGVLGEYIGGIFDEVKGRPHYIISRTLGRT
ncbi:MAG: glycosyltransferase family 2 protein [Candidatus Pacebacteria bacterium]|nr:glycosyltransferase family 2 protein [Candidatus Paceibacterota bacterium]